MSKPTLRTGCKKYWRLSAFEIHYSFRVDGWCSWPCLCRGFVSLVAATSLVTDQEMNLRLKYQETETFLDTLWGMRPSCVCVCVFFCCFWWKAVDHSNSATTGWQNLQTLIKVPTFFFVLGRNGWAWENRLLSLPVWLMRSIISPEWKNETCLARVAHCYVRWFSFFTHSWKSA